MQDSLGKHMYDNAIFLADKLVTMSGMWLRVIRNMGNGRGICNGATGRAALFLSDSTNGLGPIFVMRRSHGAYGLLRPIKVEMKYR